MYYAIIPAIFLTALARCSCTHQKSEVADSTRSSASTDSGKIEIVKLNTGRAFRFKGLAVDVKEQKAYLGSWDKKQIVAVSLKDGTHRVIPTPYSGKLNGMGVCLRGNMLYAVMNDVNDAPNVRPVSVLLVIDVTNHKVLRSYEAEGSNGRHHFNHVVVDHRGIAYISNTLKSSIYTVNTTVAGDSLKQLVAHQDLSWVHGIDLTPDGARLVSTSYAAGIKFFDLKTKSFSDFRDTTLNENDGLKYDKGYLYGIGKNALKRYTLNKAETAIIKADVLLQDHPFFNDPRCLHIEDGWIYCLTNIDFTIADVGRGRIVKKPFDDTYILKYKI